MEDTANTTPTTTDAAPGGEAAAPAQPDYAAEVERLTRERDEARSESGKVKAEHDALVRRTSLEGKVTDLNTAMKVLDPKRHLNKDGSVDVYALYTDFPILAPSSGPTAPDGGGGAHGFYASTSLESVARGGSPGEINAAFDAELKGGRK